MWQATARSRKINDMKTRNPIVGMLLEHWWKIIVCSMLAGFLTEILNTYIFKWWIYHKPWTIFILSEVPIGFPLIVGWLIITFIALILTIIFENIRPRSKLQLYWVLGWIILGFAV